MSECQSFWGNVQPVLLVALTKGCELHSVRRAATSSGSVGWEGPMREKGGLVAGIENLRDERIRAVADSEHMVLRSGMSSWNIDNLSDRGS